MDYLVNSFLYTGVYACEIWTRTAELEKRILAFEKKNFRKLLDINYHDRITNLEIVERI